MKRAWLSSLLLVAAMGAPRVGAAEGLDVGRLLDRPGVKLLAVELYATWCKPCMAAVPKWKALHEKYRRDGLRLVVVATRDPDAGCGNPGWNPDEVICDEEGTIAEALGAGEALPAAFLWSWQGHLLVRKGHVEEVERSIEEWMRGAPRVDVQAVGVGAGAGIPAADLRDLVRTRLRDTNKVIVIASDAERAALDRMKAESLKARYDDRMQCELGKDLPANSLLEVRVGGSAARQRLQLNLLSAEKGCLVASSAVDWTPKEAGASVSEGVGELLQRLRPELEMPRMRASRPAPPAQPPAQPPPPAAEVKAPQAPPAPRSPEVKPQQPAVVTRSEPLRFKEQVRFSANTAKILPASYPLLDALVEILRSRPEIQSLEIQGHTDNVGNRKYLVELSQKRAEAVRAYLVEKGIDPSRLLARGYGPDQPIQTNITAAGREQNRRVELRILR